MAKIMDGKKVSEEVLNEVAREIAEKKLRPRLAIVRVGEDEASKVYVGLKEKACARVGIESKNYILPEKTTQGQLLKLIRKLNRGPDHGVLVQLPLPKGIDEKIIIDELDPKKDVDGIHPENMGKLVSGISPFPPCTPAGVMKLLGYYKIGIEGKEAVVVGRSEIVGKPIAMMLTQRDATVTVCHSKTRNLYSHTGRADILVVAVGKPKMISGEMVKEGSAVIDVGVNRVDGKLIGDVDFVGAEKRVAYITPVPGGVGPMTVAMLMRNTLEACKRKML